MTVRPLPAPDWPSHTVQLASREVLSTMRSGAPGIPSRLPRPNLSSSGDLTVVGLSGLPTIRRAEVRLSTGCSTSPTLT